LCIPKLTSQGSTAGEAAREIRIGELPKDDEMKIDEAEGKRPVPDPA